MYNSNLSIKSKKTALYAFSRELEQQELPLPEQLENMFIEAVWTLKRLPDNESKWLYTRQTLWPETLRESSAVEPVVFDTSVRTRRNRPSPRQIDRMQPVLDMLTLLPDPEDRRIVFWACWHQNGEKQLRIPWAAAKRSLKNDATRWTLKRRYNNALEWIGKIIS